MPELIDWTFSDAPDRDAPPPAPISPVPSRRPARRTWGLLGGLVILALLGPLAFHFWTEYRVQRDIRRVIAVEESAGRAGDIDALWNLADPKDWTWRKAMLQLAINNQPAPLPSPALRPVPSSADAIAFTTLASDEVRADVTRSFLAPDGARLSFTLPQYYRFAQAAWVRVAPPQAVDTPTLWSGVHAVIAHPSADSDYVEHDLGPYLDDVLRRACQAWACPPGLTTFVKMEDGFSFHSWPGPSQQPVQAPLLFAFLRNTDPVARAPSQGYLTGVLDIQSPRLAGYPANAASAAWLRRAIAEQALNELATSIVVPAGAQRDSIAFLLALA